MIIELSLEYGIITPWTGYETPVETIALQASLLNNQVTLRWGNYEYEKGVKLKIFRKADGQGGFQLLGSFTDECYSFVDSSIRPGTAYTYKVVVTTNIEETLTGTTSIRIPGIASEFEASFYPNPFNNEARLKFQLTNPCKLSVTVYNMLGQQVKELTSGVHAAGAHFFELNASELSSGTYFVRIEGKYNNAVKGFSRVERLVVTK